MREDFHVSEKKIEPIFYQVQPTFAYTKQGWGCQIGLLKFKILLSSESSNLKHCFSNCSGGCLGVVSAPIRVNDFVLVYVHNPARGLWLCALCGHVRSAAVTMPEPAWWSQRHLRLTRIHATFESGGCGGRLRPARRARRDPWPAGLGTD
jgi:hypothetical protein